MNDRKLKLNNGWVEDNSTLRKLTKMGYHVGGWVDKGVPRYALYRADSGYSMVHEFDTPEELNRMVKLLLED